MAAPLAWYRRHVWAASAALVVAVLAAGFIALQVGLAGRVADGVRVAGVDVGGLDERAATALLARRLGAAVGTATLRTDGGEPLVLTLAQLGVTVDPAASARRALACGRHRLPGGLTVWLPGGGRDVEPVVRVDPARLEEGLQAVRAAVDVPARDARLTLLGDLVSVLPARAGREVDARALLTRVVAAVRAGRAYTGPVPVREVPPALDTAAAERLARAAAACLAQPLVLRYRDTAVTLMREDLVAVADLASGPDAAARPLSFHNGRARRLLHRLFAFAEQPPRDATVEVSRDGQVTVLPSRTGRVLDVERALDDMEAAVAEAGLRTVHVALVPAYPRLSTEEVESMGLSGLGSQFTTAFDPGDEARARNIALAAGIVDGTVVAPGETFSLNAALGPRTVNRGFDYAPVIAADHVLRQGVGGGVCQYATTLFNAVFFAGLPVVERHAHAFFIDHYPVGRDATVAWGSLDFRFRNDTPRPLMIRSWVEGGTLTVAIVGRTGRRVSYTTSPFYDIRKPAHGRDDPRVVVDDDLGPGIVRWEKGVDGRSVTVERTVRDAQGRVLFRDRFVSRYAPLDWVKRVGR